MIIKFPIYQLKVIVPTAAIMKINNNNENIVPVSQIKLFIYCFFKTIRIYSTLAAPWE